MTAIETLCVYICDSHAADQAEWNSLAGILADVREAGDDFISETFDEVTFSDVLYAAAVIGSEVRTRFYLMMPQLTLPTL